MLRPVGIMSVNGTRSVFLMSVVPDTFGPIWTCFLTAGKFFTEGHRATARCLPIPGLRCGVYGRPQKLFQGGNVDILLILFRLLAMQCKWTFTKRFTLSTTQIKCPMLRQELQKCASLAATIIYTSITIIFTIYAIYRFSKQGTSFQRSIAMFETTNYDYILPSKTFNVTSKQHRQTPVILSRAANVCELTQKPELHHD